MTNTYFILSNKPINIERLHICTWDFNGSNAAIELGFEFAPTPYVSDVEFILSLPFLEETDTVHCLMDALIRDDDNCKFIFNDTIKTNKPINGDKRNGAIIEFSAREDLAVLPIKQISVNKGECSFSVNNLDSTIKNYVRLYIPTKSKKISVINQGITKATYIYDIKINESRNLPDHIYNLINNGYKMCRDINSCFCFHVFPRQYNIAYLNSTQLKNIRFIEAEAFCRYLPYLNKMAENEYLIVFNKNTNRTDGVYTFFSEFEKETIGDKQIVLAVAANIICSLLFGMISLRQWSHGNEWYEYLPWEFWTAIVILLVFALYLFIPWNIFRTKIKNIFNK